MVIDYPEGSRQVLSPAAVRTALDKLLFSKAFSRSERLTRFLRFVVEESLAGNNRNLKEYVLGVEVFDRPESYDPRLDPIVRVEARRLRAKLQEYYRAEGADDPIRIELQDRGYQPAFVRREGTSALAAVPQEPASIAVLPFVNISADPENEYFSDGLTEELIYTLSKIENLRVVARTSVFQLKGIAADIRYIGEQLHVGLLVEGSVRRENGRARIMVQLISVADGCHLWSAAYEREIANVFAVQEEIAGAIAQALKLRIENITQRHPDDAEAYNLYLQARHFLNLRTEAGFLRSIEFFRQAIRRNPRYALAHAGLANAYSLSTRYDVLPPQEAWPKAKTAAIRALELDESIAESHTARAFVMLHFDWDWSGARDAFNHALRINPNYAVAHQWNTWALAVADRFEDAIASMKRARALDPLSPNVCADLGLTYYYARHHETALEHCLELLEVQPRFHRPHQLLGMIFLQTGREKEAVAELRQAAVLSVRNRKVDALLGLAEARAGNRAVTERILSEMCGGDRPYVSAVDVALLQTALRDRNSAFEWLEKAYAEHDGELIWLGIDPVYDDLREDRRFQDLIDRMAASAPAA